MIVCIDAVRPDIYTDEALKMIEQFLICKTEIGVRTLSTICIYIYIYIYKLYSMFLHQFLFIYIYIYIYMCVCVCIDNDCVIL